MPADKLVVIVGVTGQQGGSVAKVFQSELGWHIRGITRDPSKPSNVHLTESGVDLVAGDLDDPESLDRAFFGADMIFSVTDFWQFLTPGSSTFDEATKAGLEPNQLAMQKEIKQGRNVIDAAARAHAAKPLHRFIVSTLSDSKKWSMGKITMNLHFDGKAEYVDYLQTEYPELARQSSYLQVGYYLSNFKSFPAFAPRKDPDTGRVTFFATAAKAHGHPLPYVNAAHDTGYFVRALALSPKSPPGTVMVGYCKLLTTHEFVKLWTEVTGIEAETRPITYDEIIKGGAPSWLAAEVNQSGEYVSTYGWDGSEPGVKSPEEGGVDLSKLTDLKTWIKEEDWSSIV